MTEIEIADRFIELIQTKNFDESEVQKAYKELQKVADIDVGLDDGRVVTLGCVSFFDKALPEKEFYLGRKNAEWIVYGNAEMNFSEQYWVLHAVQQLFCVIENLKTIKKEIEGHLSIIAHEGIASYLLINPRKDVVEWALAHKDELGLVNVNHDFIEKYQAIPELKELIFQSLQSPINQ